MTLIRRFGLLKQLLTGFAAGGLFVAVLLIVGDNMLQRTSQHLVSMLESHVHPLARLHQLQSRISALRNLELELTNLRDIFMVQTQVTKMQGELDAVDAEVRDFSSRLATHAPTEATRLLIHWQEYRSSLLQATQLATHMDMAAVEEISASGTLLHLAAIQTILADVAGNTEAAADQAYQRTLEEQATQRRDFLLLVMLGASALVIGLAWSGKVVVRRIGALHEHAQRLASGEDGGDIDLSGRDEIADLAAAFVAMRAQVLSREAALRTAQLELEHRVEARTRDLLHANGQLIVFSQVIEQNPVGILIASLDGTIEYANAAYARITGRPVPAVIGQGIPALLQGHGGLDLDEILRTVAAEKSTWEAERCNERPDGTITWERLRLAVVHGEDQAAAHLLLSLEDITERHLQQERITYQAHYDALTGLPNRLLAHDRLVQAIGHSRRDGSKAATLYIDLDNFKQINDTLGHAIGDGLLRQAAVRLQGVIRQEDTVARLGGDEFLIITAGLADGDDASVIAEKLIVTFAAPFSVEGHELATSPSIGVAIYPYDGTDPTVLLRNADLAMYQAKESGRNTYRFFDPKMNSDAVERLNLLGKLRGAVERDELALYFQPQVDVKTGAITGAEALLRWHHPELGIVPPGRFISIAEDSGLIVPIGKWVLQEACRQAVAWQRAGFPNLVTAVNLSAVQFRSPDLYDTVVEALQEAGLDPSLLELELTESILIRDTEPVLKTVTKLKTLGLKLSIDDFGTGYSSLAYLKRFPIDKLKVDQSFVREMASDAEDAALVQAIIQMAKTLGLKTIAEGVENDAVLHRLHRCHCDEAQGYLFGRPMPAEDFAAYLRARCILPGSPVVS